MRTQLDFQKADKSLNNIKAFIQETTQDALSQIEKKIQLKHIDIFFYVSKKDTIQHIGIGGYTKTPTLIMIPIDPNFSYIKKSITTELPKTLAHELFHAIRNYSYEGSYTLFEAMVNEGLADHFEIEVFGGTPGNWDTALSQKDIDIFLKKSKPDWDKKDYDHNTWFFGSKKKGIPKWTGYSLGFHLVGQYLKKNSDLKPSSLINKKVEAFLPTL